MPDILHRVGIQARPERGFNAITTIEGLRGWWVSETTGDADAGGIIDFGFCRMKVIATNPNQLVHWRCVKGPEEWAGTVMTFALSWKDEQAFVLFKHADWKQARPVGEVRRTPGSA